MQNVGNKGWEGGFRFAFCFYLELPMLESGCVVIMEWIGILCHLSNWSLYPIDSLLWRSRLIYLGVNDLDDIEVCIFFVSFYFAQFLCSLCSSFLTLLLLHLISKCVYIYTCLSIYIYVISCLSRCSWKILLMWAVMLCSGWSIFCWEA